MPIAAAAIGAGTSLFSGLFGASQASQASQAQSAAAAKAQQLIAQNQQQALGLQSGMWKTLQGAQQPYLGAGQTGAAALNSLLSTPGQGLLQGWNQQFQAPTAAQAAQTPGYQFALQQGLNAVQSSAAAQGNLLTGGTMKALNNYAQGMASTNYQQTYNNAFQQYQQQYNQFQQNQANQYSRLMGLAGIGQTATGQLSSAGTGIAGAMGNVMMGGAQAQANALQSQGAAQAAGYMNQANAITGMGQGLGNAGLLYAYGPQLFGQQNQNNTSNAVGNLGDYTSFGQLGTVPSNWGPATPTTATG